MALCDYKLCNICECKVFYDATVTDDAYYDAEEEGRLIAICRNCHETHDIKMEYRKKK